MLVGDRFILLTGGVPILVLILVLILILAMPVGVGQPVEYSVQAAHHRYQWVYGHLSLVHGSAHVKAAATQSGGGGCESKPAIGGPICTT